ncbi:MAG: methionyl-tRNA formyltransferase [Pseudohongiellaceae bacterium]
MPPLRIIFAGTPDFAASHLEALLAGKHNIVAVYTQPDRPSGRGKQLLPSPVKTVALQHNVAVFQPSSLKSREEHARLKSLDAHLLVVVAYGLILPQAVLDIPVYGGINVHASMLPRWRGAAPVERALLAGDKATGITIMQMDAGLDTGPMLHQQPVKIEADDTRVTLEEKLVAAGRKALLYTLDNYLVMRDNAQAQGEAHSTYAKKVEKTEARIRWHEPARLIDCQVRAGIGRYPAYTFIDGQRVRLVSVTPDDTAAEEIPGTIVAADSNSLTVACGGSTLRVHALQLPGKKPMTAREVFNSRRKLFQRGKRFTDSELDSENSDTHP